MKTIFQRDKIAEPALFTPVRYYEKNRELSRNLCFHILGKNHSKIFFFKRCRKNCRALHSKRSDARL